MDRVVVSSNGRIAIPKAVRWALNLHQGAKLTIEVRGQEIILSPEPSWRNLRGAASDPNLTNAFTAFRKKERERAAARHAASIVPLAVIEAGFGREKWHS
jgi:AbrB family looped-hinge helix DNA binding protein